MIGICENTITDFEKYFKKNDITKSYIQKNIKQMENSRKNTIRKDRI